MSSIVVAGDSSGSITIAAPAVAGSGTLTLPVATDTLVGKATTDTLTNKTLTAPVITGATITVASTAAPAFSAYQSTLQSIANSTFAKLALQTEEFDTNSNYDNGTNYRFTPTVAGYYQVNGAFGTASAAASLLCSVYKNGADFKRGTQSGTAANSGEQSVVAALIYMNGSTDYVEIYAYQNSGAAINSSASINRTYFQAFLARSA